ncbi:MAG: MFS transporter [bacterium]
MRHPTLPRWLNKRTPFFYGWVILFCACCAGFARQGPAVAPLSIFITPMTSEFGWSLTSISAAVSAGGILAALSSPFLGPYLDKYGPRIILSVSILFTGFTVMLLSFTDSLAFFFILFCLARMNFAGPFDLGIYGSINNWFFRSRGLATAITTFIQMLGLVAMPLIAQASIQYNGWRFAWVVIGITVLVVGFLPNYLLQIKKPEDLGLFPDGLDPSKTNVGHEKSQLKDEEPKFSREEALKTKAFWVLCLYTVLIYPVQAGISLHQAPHLIERQIDTNTTATIIATFSFLSAVSGVIFGLIVRRITIRLALIISAFSLATSSCLMLIISTSWQGYLSAIFFGIGIGGILTILPIAWADFFGRKSYGSIRGVVLFFQVSAQAFGPLLSGILRDHTGNYETSLSTFFVFSILAVMTSIFASPPKPI